MLKSRRQAGLSLIESTITLGVTVVVLGGFGLSVLSTQSATEGMREHDMVRAQSAKYMERLIALPYGTLADPPARAPELQELFDDNAVITGGGPLSLMALRTPIGNEGWRFRVQGFEARGVFEIEINSDLDGNGTRRGVRGPETPTMSGGLSAGDGTTVTDLEAEGRAELLRVEIFWNGESLLRTMRAAPVEGV